MYKYIPSIILCLLFVTSNLSAQVERTTLFGVGGANVQDTYLSPYASKGPAVSILLQTERPAHWGCGNVSTIGRYSLEGAMARSVVSASRQYDGTLSLAFGWRRNWLLANDRWHLALGGIAELAGGGTYSTMGGNNPAQGRFGVDVALTAQALYLFKVHGAQWQARLQTEVPLLGAAFAQQYGLSYYELFHLGHYNHNVRPTWLGNAPSLRMQATLSIPVRHSCLVVGYGADIRQANLNQIKQHGWYNQFLIGFSRKLTLSR